MMQFVRKHWKLLLIVTVVLALGWAMAQDEFVFDPVGWGENPALALTALMGVVAMIRQTKWGSSIDGPVRVAILTAVIGMLGGVALQMFGMLTHPTVAAYPSPWGGLLYGLGLAFTAMTGVFLWFCVSAGMFYAPQVNTGLVVYGWLMIADIYSA